MERLTDEEIKKIAKPFLITCEDHFVFQDAIPERDIYDFARAIEKAVLGKENKMENTLKNDLEIDKFALDEEWEKQPMLYLKYAEDLAISEINRDNLKDLIEVEKASVERKIREKPEEYGITGKPTEGAIKAAILGNKEIEKITIEYFEASKEAKLLGAVVKSLDHRKKALEKLVDLFLAGYFSKPNSSGSTINHIENAKRSKKEQTELLNKPKRRKINND